MSPPSYATRGPDVTRDDTADKGRKFPAEVLTTGEVAAVIGGCSPKAPTGIRNRALITLLYRSALRASDVNSTAHTACVLHGKGNEATTGGFTRATEALAAGDSAAGLPRPRPPCWTRPAPEPAAKRARHTAT